MSNWPFFLGFLVGISTAAAILFAFVVLMLPAEDPKAEDEVQP